MNRCQKVKGYDVGEEKGSLTWLGQSVRFIISKDTGIEGHSIQRV